MRITGTLGNRAGLAPLKRALEAYALRHRVIAANIANAETPGYQPRRVEFEAREAAVGAGRVIEGYVTDPRHIQVGRARSPEVTANAVSPSASESVGGAGVDVEKEMISLVENQLSYRLAVRLLDMKYNTLQKAISGRSR